ncbi:hypothetical protein VISI1226_19871 [Vibrio sinaloensis DSM 21326]|uniref:Uncharacterized protein n=1 Tax=Vibrio sinaloensis DSM 21326 TaxID=945550 RepID=E8M9S8_PHOS4|nr:hypothetical protein VISI1226_19871 [Vibrio sinaloensis DSM 21326]
MYFTNDETPNQHDWLDLATNQKGAVLWVFFLDSRTL